MNQNLNEQILDKLTKVCICKSVSRAKIKEAIANGCNTLESVQKATSAGTGCCKGYKCNCKIQDLIDSPKSN